jgi:hypothetical protein
MPHSPAQQRSPNRASLLSRDGLAPEIHCSSPLRTPRPPSHLSFLILPSLSPVGSFLLRPQPFPLPPAEQRKDAGELPSTPPPICPQPSLLPPADQRTLPEAWRPPASGPPPIWPRPAPLPPAADALMEARRRSASGGACRPSLGLLLAACGRPSSTASGGAWPPALGRIWRRARKRTAACGGRGGRRVEAGPLAGVGVWPAGEPQGPDCFIFFC